MPVGYVTAQIILTARWQQRHDGLSSDWVNVSHARWLVPRVLWRMKIRLQDPG